MSKVIDLRRWKVEHKLSPQEREIELENIRIQEFEARIARIRHSINRINSLLEELRVEDKKEDKK